MIERPSAGLPEATPAAADAGGASSEAQAEIARRAQFLTTEHWSLLATRSMSWNEAFSRTSMFLSTLSAATVALALAGPVMAFGGMFPLFALVVLSVTLFLGVATYVRLLQVNNEDLLWVFGMNRLRGAYTRISPGIEKEFVAGWTVDPQGIARTFGAVNVTSNPSPLHALLTTPAVVGVISCAIGGVIAGLVTTQLGVDEAFAIGAGIVTFLASVVLMLAYGLREYRRFVARVAVEQHDQELTPGAADRDVQLPRRA
jgi:hypothetical protein